MLRCHLYPVIGSFLPVDKIYACFGWYSNSARFSRTKGTCLALNDPDQSHNSNEHFPHITCAPFIAALLR